MTLRAKSYLFLVAATAGCLYFLTLVHGGFQGLDLPRALIGLAWFAGIALIAEAMAVNFRIGPVEHVRSSLAFLPFLSGLILFPTLAAVSVIVVVSTISQFLLRRAQPWRAVFNISQGALAGFAAGFLFHSITPSDTYSMANLWFPAAFAAAATTFFVVNMLLSSIALALLKDDNVIRVFKQIVGTGGANLWYDLLASPLALVPAILYADDPVTGVIVILLPLLLVQYSYLSKLGLIDANRDLMRALVKAIETRDPYTSGHSFRVATLAKAVASDMELKNKMLANVEVAAWLHDIGKIDPVFATVLSKPFALSDEEFELIKKHSEKGAEMLEGMRSVPAVVVSAVRHHHERYDGQGYPDKLVGKQIPMIARIIMLCDSIDAMLSDRPYRKALPIETVRKELLRCSGTQFDPDIARIVLEKNTLERAVKLIQAEELAHSMDQIAWH